MNVIDVVSATLVAIETQLVKLVEAHLIRLNLIMKTDGGRVLTQKGLDYLRTQDASISANTGDET